MPIDFPPIPGLSVGGDYISRLREAAYESPGGTRIKFKYTEVRRNTNLRGTAWEFGDTGGAYIQRFKFGPREYPLRCIFVGKTHDLEAQAFESALLEDGVGSLDHPRYGTVGVVPLGSMGAQEFVVDDAAATYVEVTFFTTISDLYPSALSGDRNELLSAIDGFDVESAQSFSDGTDLLTAAARASTGSTIKGLLRNVSSALRTVSDQTKFARRAFSDQVSLINEGMDVLVGQPLLLAREIRDLIRAPSRALAGFITRIEGYKRLLDALLASDAANQVTQYTSLGLALRQKNDLHTVDMMLQNVVVGSVMSAIDTPNFRSREDALAAASEMIRQYDAIVDWRDNAYKKLNQVDTGGSMVALHRVVGLAAGNLIRISFSAAQERTVTLAKARTLVDLAAELYGSIDGGIDAIIATNALSGDELLELPRGRVIRYYPRA